MDSDQGCPFAVAVPVIGQRSETFICNHMNDVLPGRTAAVGELLAEPAAWKAKGPTLVLRPQNANIKILHGIERLGILPAKKLVGFLRENGVQALMVEYLHSFLPYMPHVQAAGIKWYSFGHGYDISALLLDPKWRARLQIHKQADGVFVRAESIRQRMIDFGLDGNKVFKIPGSSPVPDHPTEHGSDATVRLLCVGRMVAKKAPVKTLEAFRIALESYPQLELHYVGDGPLKADADAYVRDHGLAERAKLYGAKPHDFVLNLMENLDIYLQHSLVDPVTGDEEGLPTSIVEAMGRCMPTVSTFHAGIPEAIRDGVDGLLCVEGDVETMAAHIVELARSPERRHAMGLSSWNRARDEYRWERERDQILRYAGLERFL